MLTRERWRYAARWLIERALKVARFALNYATIPATFWFFLPHGPQFRVQFAIAVLVSIVNGTLNDMKGALRSVETSLEQVTRELERLKWRIK